MKKPTILAALVLAVALATAAPAAAAPELDVQLDTHPDPTAGIPIGGTAGQYEITVSNVGDTPTSASVSVDLALPAGLKATAVYDTGGAPSLAFWSCSIAPDSQSVSCSGPDNGGLLAIEPGEEACASFDGTGVSALCRIVVTVVPDQSEEVGDVLTASVEACGGGAASCAGDSRPTEVVPAPLFDFVSLDGGTFEDPGPPYTQKRLDVLGDEVTQAGSHPFLGMTDFRLTTQITPAGQSVLSEILRDVIAQLPPGLTGNPQAVASCEMATFTTGGTGGCPAASQVGLVSIFVEGSGIPGESGTQGVRYNAPLYNLQPPRGTAALLGFRVTGVPLTISAEVRSDGDYGITAASRGTPVIVLTSGAKVEAWGVPADPSHDAVRGACINAFGTLTGNACPSPDVTDPKAFFTLPTSCAGQPRTDLTVTSWEGSEVGSSFLSPTNTGCDTLNFEPTLKAAPSTNVADQPSGLDFDLHIPQASEHCQVGPPISCPRATAHLRDTTLTLPEGMALNPSGANGLDACSASQAGLLTGIDSEPIHFKAEPSGCPDDSKVGSVRVETPLLDHSVKGSLYVAEPHRNPFGSLLALYLSVEDPESGTFATLAGEVEADSDSGRLTTTFEDNPQLPLSEIEVDVFGGAGAPLVTPPTCETHTTRTELTSWAGDRVSPSDSWKISKGPGTGCASSESKVPHLPSFEAGTVRPIAGIHTPFVLNLRRPDGSQRFGSLTVSPPPGLTASLAATPPCPEALLAAAERKDGKAEQRNPSCPLASRVGAVHAQAGAGPAPYNAPGTAYLAGPYKGAPLSLAIITPAVAGPFDLGVVVIRTALYVNPTTAQITAVSDPIPSMLEGIPLNVRSASVRLDKPGFSLNPTSCDPMLFGGTLSSTEGAVAQLIERFQLAECGRLGFKPKVNLRLFGGIKRAKYQGVRAVVRPRPGDANISRTVVRFPRSAFVAQEHIRTICTRVQWAADACPKGSIYGKAIAQSPLLSYPLEGNVYLRSSDNELPDAVADLRGPAWQPLRVEVAIRNDSVKGALRNTVQVAPDAPVSHFRLQLFGGKKGLIVNSRNICVGSNKATVVLGAHNGARTVLKPNALNPKCAKAKRKAKAKKRRAAKRKRAARRAAAKR